MGDSLFLSMNGIIYKATNRYNGYVYIGQTRATLASRMQQHFRDAKRDSNLFHLALLQYGEEGFEWETLDEFSGTKEEVIHALNVAEEYHILKNKSMLGDRGYNATQGGYSSDKFAEEIKRRAKATGQYRPVLQYDLQGNFIREYESITEVGREFGVTANIASLIGLAWNGYQWRDKIDGQIPKKIKAYKPNNVTLGILAYSINGDFYKEFRTQTECFAELGKKYKIRKNFADTVMRVGSKDEYLVFKMKNYSYPSRIVVKFLDRGYRNVATKKDRPVLQYSKKGVLLKEFPSVQAAHRATGVCQSAIRKWCESLPPFRTNHSKTRWIWRYKEEEVEQHIDVTGKRYAVVLNHAVVQYDQDGNTIKVWKNIEKASAGTGESAYLIKRQCLGLRTQKKTPSVWKLFRDSQVAI